MHILVIAYGNPLRGDDGFAWQVAGKLDVSTGVEVITQQQLTPELAESLSRADLAIFIDASAERTATRLTCRPIKVRCSTSGAGPRPAQCAPIGQVGDLPHWASQKQGADQADALFTDALFTHHVAAEELLLVARELYGHAPEAHMISAAAASFECGEKLSPAVENVVEPAARLAEQIIDEFVKRVPTLS